MKRYLCVNNRSQILTSVSQIGYVCLIDFSISLASSDSLHSTGEETRSTLQASEKVAKARSPLSGNNNVRFSLSSYVHLLSIASAESEETSRSLVQRNTGERSRLETNKS